MGNKNNIFGKGSSVQLYNSSDGERVGLKPLFDIYLSVR
jgi:hypothetical protein